MGLHFEKYAAKGNEMLKDLVTEMGLPQNDENKDKAGRILRAVLHGLREVIPMEESFQLISQLPMYLKAVYVDGWQPSKEKAHRHIKHQEDFIALIYEKGGRASVDDFPDTDATKEHIIAVFQVLKTRVSEGEVNDVRGSMPQSLKNLWDEPIWQF